MCVTALRMRLKTMMMTRIQWIVKFLQALLPSSHTLTMMSGFVQWELIVPPEINAVQEVMTFLVV